MTKPRSIPQSRKLHALCNDIARQHPLIPYRQSFAREAWKRFIIACFIRETRLEAYHAGLPDPFPVRPVPSSSLDNEQMGELLAFSEAWCATHGIELAK